MKVVRFLQVVCGCACVRIDCGLQNITDTAEIRESCIVGWETLPDTIDILQDLVVFLVVTVTFHP